MVSTCINSMEFDYSDAPKSSAIAGFLSRIADHFEQRAKHKIDREAFQQMLKLEDKILDDIGVTRADVRWANSLPISVNASKALQDAIRFSGAKSSADRL